MKKIFILTGEASGDKLASRVIEDLKLRCDRILAELMAPCSVVQPKLIPDTIAWFLNMACCYLRVD